MAYFDCRPISAAFVYTCKLELPSSANRILQLPQKPLPICRKQHQLVRRRQVNPAPNRCGDVPFLAPSPKTQSAKSKQDYCQCLGSIRDARFADGVAHVAGEMGGAELLKGRTAPSFAKRLLA